MLAISQFRVANGLAPAVREAFVNRPHLVEHAPGFQGINVFTKVGDETTFLLITRWTDLESYRVWHSSEAHVLSHRGIPPGLKLDAAYTQLTYWDEIPQPRDDSANEPAAPDWTAAVADFVASSGLVYFIAAGNDGAIDAINTPMAELLRVPEETLRGQAVWPYLTDADAARLRSNIGGSRTPGSNEASSGKGNENLLLNFVTADQVVHTLECRVYVRDGLFAVFGSFPVQQNPALQQELREADGELHVLTREHARQNKELKTAKLALEQTILELNTVYWHLRRVREVLPICVKCGKVESGEARWETLIDFMQDHFPFLSHGCCPECAPRLFESGQEPGPAA
jgi:heme-degrading monooxygenase HmoA